ncbi:MAG: pyroglutamyl-peptidase I [Hyphomicrobiaceae bacterium]
MPSDRQTILLTGFGPFPSIAANATSVLVPRIAAAAADAFAGVAIVHDILPTEWTVGLARVGELYRLHRPALALHFGVSGRARGFEIETRGRNYCSLSKDAAGKFPLLRRLSPEGPEFLPVTLPAAHIAQRLRRRGIPATVSRDAGGYLCNALLYRTAELARGQPTPVRSGFIHLPSDLVNERNPARGPQPGCRLTWSEVVDGSLEIIAASLGRPSAPSDVRRMLPRRLLPA